MSAIKIEVIGEVKENSILVLRENVEDLKEIHFDMLSKRTEKLPKGAIVIISDEDPLLFDESEMNKRGWFKNTDTLN